MRTHNKKCFITKTCPCNYTAIFKVVKNENFQQTFFDRFLIFAQNIDCGYTLEQGGGSNEYPQSMFWNKNKKNRYTPAYPSFAYDIKVGFKGVYFSWTCFPDVKKCCFIAATRKKDLPHYTAVLFYRSWV